jgi:hypothetical protein
MAETFVDAIEVAPTTVEQPQVVKQPKVVKHTGKAKVLNAPAKRVPIAEGETRKRLLEVVPNTRTVRATYTFKVDAKSTDEYPVESVFDFSGCTDEEILILASSSVRITIQAKLRAMGDVATNIDTFANVDVKTDVLNSARLPVDETLKTIRQLARVTGITEAAARAIVERELNNRK